MKIALLHFFIGHLLFSFAHADTDKVSRPCLQRDGFIFFTELKKSQIVRALQKESMKSQYELNKCIPDKDYDIYFSDRSPWINFITGFFHESNSIRCCFPHEQTPEKPFYICETPDVYMSIETDPTATKIIKLRYGLVETHINIGGTLIDPKEIVTNKDFVKCDWSNSSGPS